MRAGGTDAQRKTFSLNPTEGDLTPPLVHHIPLLTPRFVRRVRLLSLSLSLSLSPPLWSDSDHRSVILCVGYLRLDLSHNNGEPLFSEYGTGETVPVSLAVGLR